MVKQLVNVLGNMFSLIGLSKRGKRSLYAVSLYAHIKRLDIHTLTDDDVSDIAKTVGSMVLCGLDMTPTSVSFPLKVSSALWRDLRLPTDHVHKPAEIENMANYLVDRCPDWLKYDTTTLHDDARRLVVLTMYT